VIRRVVSTDVTRIGRGACRPAAGYAEVAHGYVRGLLSSRRRHPIGCPGIEATRDRRTLWRAGVDAFGPSDLRAELRATDQGIASVFAKEFGDVEKDAKLLDDLSPLRDADKIRVPLFVYQGENDARVPRPQSDTIVAAMRARGVPVEYMVVADEGHSMDRKENLFAFLTRVARFLGDRIK
jgi:dipeptidyl aminopeptidase/acylaminoacyl peptidase